MNIDTIITNYLRYYPTFHHIILYCSYPEKHINILNLCISTIITKKDGKTIIYKKILNYNNIENNNIYIYMIYTHNNELIRGTIYNNNNNKNFKINNYYYNSFYFKNKFYDHIAFCKYNL
jgi:hypothetical protein